jgi:hypothetical protein
MRDTNTISLREFARRLSVTEGAVRKAIKDGKIVKGVQYDEKNRPAILLVVAAKEWGRNFNPAYPRNEVFYGKLEAASEGGTPAPESQGRSLVEIKKMHAEIKLQLEAIELRKAKNELVDKKKVYAQLFAMGQEVRAAFQAIPDRVTDTVLAARDRAEAHKVISDAIADTLTQLSDITKRDIN